MDEKGAVLTVRAANQVQNADGWTEVHEIAAPESRHGNVPFRWQLDTLQRRRSILVGENVNGQVVVSGTVEQDTLERDLKLVEKASCIPGQAVEHMNAVATVTDDEMSAVGV